MNDRQKAEMLMENRIRHLKKWRKETAEEFDKHEGFYSIEFIVNQFRAFDKKIKELEAELFTMYLQSKKEGK